MEAIKAVFDGYNFKPIEPIPVNGRYEVVITFTKPIIKNENKCHKILKHFGTWNNNDILNINKIVEERINFSINREEI